VRLLLESIEKLKESKISKLIESRISEFSAIRKESIDEIFKELCFCIMTANCGAVKCIEIHNLIGDDFLSLSEEGLVAKFREYGYRFPNIRSNYILQAREFKEKLEQKLHSSADNSELREWIVKNIKGIGYKEGSHFLRNIGYTNYAIIDFHIIDLLVNHKVIERPKTVSKRKYLEIEETLKNIGARLNLNLAQLDLYLWYLETGQILK